MKLVEILAKELSEWPESAVCITQDSGGTIYGWAQTGAEYRNLAWYSPDGEDFGMHDIEIEAPDEASDNKKSVVTRAQWQAERDRQKGGEWKRHRAGRKQPVEDGVFVEYKLRGGVTGACPASRLAWSHMGDDTDVMQYRAISQPQAEEVEVKDTTIGTLSYKVEIDTTEATQAIDELAAKWDQIETPFKWRDEVTELNAYIEKYTRERDALIDRLASEGFALIPPVVSVMSDFSGVDMSDWRNWKEGDVIEVIANKGGHEFETGDEVTVINIDEEDVTYRIEATKDGEDWWLAKSDGKFIRRP